MRTITRDGEAERVLAMNRKGQAVGAFGTPADPFTRPYRWTPGRGVRELEALGGPGIAVAVNAFGMAAGGAYTAKKKEFHATVWLP
jgi:hypothetical protein